MNDYLAISTEVRQALDAATAVVAFESTIISHGMPYPQNFETARAVEEAARVSGANAAVPQGDRLVVQYASGTQQNYAVVAMGAHGEGSREHGKEQQRRIGGDENPRHEAQRRDQVEDGHPGRGFPVHRQERAPEDQSDGLTD